MYECKFNIGDLVVEKGTDFFSSIKICRVTEIELVDEDSDMWDVTYDTKPYWFITTEIVYWVKDKQQSMLREIGDFECFEEWEIESFEKYMNRQVTLQDYIDVRYNGKSYYSDEEDA